ncbi:hypothetical protein MMC17_002264 [Xylographa soralifera]|nr:hypothetical protein [Xylographa soralifera]
MLVVKTEPVSSSTSPSDLSTTSERPLLTAREKSKRPQLSCNACRTRKVKCDRIQPCTACSLHQQADLCHYELTEAERHPILQAEALKGKDREITRLRAEIRMLEEQSSKIPRHPDSDQRQLGKRKADLLSKEIGKPVVHQGSWRHYSDKLTDTSFRVRAVTDGSKEASGKTIDPIPSNGKQPNTGDGLKTTELESSNVTITKCFPLQMATTYPFPTLWRAIQGTSGFADLLPARNDLFMLLDAFKCGSQALFLPYIPEECSSQEVEQFLGNFEHSFTVYPDRVALLLATLAVGVICEGHAQNGKGSVMGSKQDYQQKGDLFVAASMQALRTASFMSRPTIRVIETLLIIDAYLANTEKSLDASSLFAITVRLAQGLGMYRNPAQLRPPVSPTEAYTRQRLWWWMLHMDQQYSVALGRPLAISSVGDCPWTDSIEKGLERRCLETPTNHFTLLSRRILSDNNSSIAQSREFADLIVKLQDTIPTSMRFEDDWMVEEKFGLENQDAALLHGQMHYLLLMLFRQQQNVARLSKDNSRRRSGNIIGQIVDIALPTSGQILKSCRSILQVFVWFNSCESTPMIGWAIRQQALNAAWTIMIELEDDKDIGMVQETYNIFVELPNLSLHSLMSEAVGRLGTLLAAHRAGNNLEMATLKEKGSMLLENAELFGTLPFVLSPVTHATSASESPQVMNHKGSAHDVGGRECPSTLSDKVRKHRKTDAKPGPQNKAPEKRPSEKKSTEKQRRTSTAAQKRNSVTLAKDKRQRHPSTEEFSKSPMQSLGVAASNMHIDMLETALPWSFLATQNGLSTTPTIASPATAAVSYTNLDCSVFPEMSTSVIDPHVYRKMTPFQISTAAKHKDASQQHVSEMRRNSFLPSSGEPTPALGVAHQFSQFPSPPQSQGSADSPASPHLYLPINNHNSLQSQPGCLPHRISPDPYGHTFHNLLFGQTHIPVSNDTQADSDASNVSWQMPYEGFSNPH